MALPLSYFDCEGENAERLPVAFSDKLEGLSGQN
jgi:hypothetical protein